MLALRPFGERHFTNQFGLHPMNIAPARNIELKRRLFLLKRAQFFIHLSQALMIESGGHRRFDKLIVVWCEPDLQLQRLMHRDNLNATDAGKRIAAQMSQDEKKKHADYLIDTSNDYENTRRQVAEVFERLKLS